MAARHAAHSPPERNIDMRALWRAAWPPAMRRQEHAFNMRSVRRLAMWGASATIALAIALVAGLSETGSRRLAAAPAASGGSAATLAQPAARLSEYEAETRRLTEVVHILAADRQRLAARIDTLERNLEDVTGSIKQQASPAPATPAPAPTPAPLTAIDQVPASGDVGGAPIPPKQAAVTPAAPAGGSAQQPAAPTPPPAPLAAPAPPAIPAEPEPSATAAGTPTSEAEAPPSEFGIDIGGAVSFDGLRALWVSTKGRHPAFFASLQPVVTARENARTKTVELRLIAGPLNADAAARICAALQPARRYCQPVAFEGQQLAQADAVPERKPTAERRPAAAPKPAPKPSTTPAPRSVFPFY